jgi:hypothetical protein
MFSIVTIVAAVAAVVDVLVAKDNVNENYKDPTKKHYQRRNG